MKTINDVIIYILPHLAWWTAKLLHPINNAYQLLFTKLGYRVCIKRTHVYKQSSVSVHRVPRPYDCESFHIYIFFRVDQLIQKWGFAQTSAVVEPNAYSIFISHHVSRISMCFARRVVLGWWAHIPFAPQLYTHKHELWCYTMCHPASTPQPPPRIWHNVCRQSIFRRFKIRFYFLCMNANHYSLIIRSIGSDPAQPKHFWGSTNGVSLV